MAQDISVREICGILKHTHTLLGIMWQMAEFIRHKCMWRT